ALDPLDRLVHRLDLPDPVAGDELLGLREWPVDDGALLALEANALALGGRMQPFARQHDADLDQLLVELAHLAELLLRRQLARFRFLGRLHAHHDSHRRPPGLWLPYTLATNGPGPDRHALNFFLVPRKRC